MKSFDEDWSEIQGTLPVWERLEPYARRLALEYLRPSAPQPAGPLEGVLPELVGAGFAELSPTGARVGVVLSMRPLFRLLRELARAPLWPAPDENAMRVYLAEHFTGDELEALGRPAGQAGWGWGKRYIAATLAGTEEWVESFLAAGTKAKAEAWENDRREISMEAPLFGTAEVREGTRRLVEALLERAEPAPLAELAELLPGISAPEREAALRAALRYLLVFAALDDEALPRIGVWPEVAALRNRPEATPPGTVEVVEEFHAAVLMEDATSVLVAAAAEPLRVRANDNAIFARTRQEIAARIVQAPGWTEPFVADADERIEMASRLLQVQQLAEIVAGWEERRGRRRAHGELRLAPTAKGTSWLALSEHDRLASLLDPLRTQKPRKRGGYWEEEAWGFSTVRYGHGEDADLREPLTRAFASVDGMGYVSLAAFLSYQARTANPLLEKRARPRGFLYMDGIGRLASRAHAERLWMQVLGAFLSERLLALGGARLGRTAEGHLAFALASPGRYLLGLADEFDYGVSPEAALIVQPNFEIVFLTPAPKLEAQIGRFAERAGTGPGVMFRLTRASVLAAAEAGMEADAPLETLAAASMQPLPENVVRQVHDWFRLVRRVHLRDALLVECPDAETAARVQSAVGRGVRPLTPTLLEVAEVSKKARAALLKQLRAGGVFVES